MSLYQRVGDLLVVKGYVTKEDVRQAIEVQKHSDKKFGQILVTMGAANEEQVVICLSEQFNLPIADVDRMHPEPAALDLISEEVALEHMVLPLRLSEKSFDCVVADPIDTLLVDHLKSSSMRPVKMLLATPTRLETVIRRSYDGREKRSA